ncbi:MAG: HEPN domain-containing protein [Actinomycetes bacterium]
MTAEHLRRSRTELEAARLLATSGFHAQAISRAYYAAFWAAESALAAVDIARSRHSGVVAAFGTHVVLNGGVPPRHGRDLHTLFDLRNAVDYGDVQVSEEQALEAVDDAERLLEAVDEWLSG